MCSFDVCSLFINVPLDETIQICLNKLYSLPEPPRLPRPALKTLLEFATKKSHFIFDGQYYDQVDSVAMGSPLGPVLANIFMCHFEEQWVNNTVACPSIWFRYVDDTFSLFASSFLHYLNNRHPNIKFTMHGTRRKPRDPILRCPHQTPSKCLLYNSTPQKDFHRSLHQVGFFHTKKVQSQFNLHPHLSLFSHLFDIFFITGCSL